MLYLMTFYIFLLGASFYALRKGGAPEKIVGTMMLMAAVGTTTTTYLSPSFSHVHEGELIVDIALMVGLMAVAAKANRYWPMYIAALHLLGVGIHGVRALDPTILPVVYARAPAAVAYPMLALLVLGTLRHTRRLNAGLPERAWTPSQRHDYAV